MKIIKSPKDWKNYLKFCQDKYEGYECSFLPKIPPEYPVIVVSNFQLNMGAVIVTNRFVRKDLAKELLRK